MSSAAVSIWMFFFFFEQKTAYEMRISDWSSDVCSSDLNVLDLDIWMAAEDFAFYSQAAPACFYRLGIRNERRGIVSTVHTPTFDIDERALETGPGLMAYLALKEMNEGQRL